MYDSCSLELVVNSLSTRIVFILKETLSLQIGLSFWVLLFRIRKLHDLEESRYVNFKRLFSKDMSLEHDKDITHIILTSFVCTLPSRWIKIRF